MSTSLDKYREAMRSGHFNALDDYEKQFRGAGLAWFVGHYVNMLDEALAKLDTAEETHRMQLAAISVVASANTSESLSKQMLQRDNPYWTVALADVRRAVSSEIEAREALEAAKPPEPPKPPESQDGPYIHYPGSDKITQRQVKRHNVTTVPGGWIFEMYWQINSDPPRDGVNHVFVPEPK